MATLRELFGRGRHAEPVDPAVAIRAAISALAAARDTATANAAAALVNQAQVRRALALQRDELRRAIDGVDAAIAIAARVVETATEQDGAAAAAPYVAHLDGLQSQRDVVERAGAQLEQLDGASAGQVDRARSLLRDSRRTLDTALREQLRLLIAVERLERARAIGAARARAVGTGSVLDRAAPRPCAEPGRPEEPGT